MSSDKNSSVGYQTEGSPGIHFVWGDKHC
jgi:hypothetical protein